MKKKKILIFLVLSTQVFGQRFLSVKKYEENSKKQENEAIETIQKKEIQSSTKKVSERRRKISSNEINLRKKIVETALLKLNAPYFFGASGSDKFDCSSFLQYVYKKSLNISLPRVSYEQANAGKKINYKNLEPGDIIAFDTLDKNRITHVGLYIGKNQFIHASSGYKKVVVSELTGFYAEKFRYGVKII